MDIDEWIKSQRNQIIKESKEFNLFDEIAGSLKSGFLRSSYIMSWVAIAENLKNKILQSSNLGDKQAEQSFKVIEEAEAKKLSVDKIILDEVAKLSLVDVQELTVLNFLWQQRCLFAHPYNLAPTEDECKYAICQLVSICLSKPLLFKKSYLTELASNLVDKPYFISEEREKLELYFNTVLTRVTDDLHPFLFKTLLASLGKLVDDDSKSNIRFKLRIALTSLLNKTSRSLDDSSWSLEHRALNFPFVTFYGCVNQLTWKKLPIRIKDILVDYCMLEINENRLATIKLFFAGLIMWDVLEEQYKSKYHLKLDTMSFQSAINFYGENSKAFDRIIIEEKSNNFVRQNTLIDYLREENGRAFVKKLGKEQQIGVGKAIMHCAKNGSWTAMNYLQTLASNKNSPKYVIAGLFIGCLIDDGDGFYYRLTHFDSIIKTAKELTLDEGKEVIEIASLSLDNMTGKSHHVNDNDFQIVKKETMESGLPFTDSIIELLEKFMTFKLKFDDLPDS